jgi:hypothetical protein
MSRVQLLRWDHIEFVKQVRSPWDEGKSICQGPGIPSELHPLKQ